MKYHIVRVALLAFFIPFNLHSAEETYDFAELVDENYVSIEQIDKVQNSDNASYDIEDHTEQFSKKDKILIVGDSWASFPCIYNSMGKMIRDVDADIKEDNRCLRTTKLGITGAEWIGSKWDLKTIKFLKETPRLKYLYLSLGGNDLMAVWNKDFTLSQELEVYEKTFQTVKKIIDRYLAVRPDIKIIVSGYDYPHFTPNHKIGLYKKIFERMGSPLPERINPTLAGLCKYMSGLANGKSIFYVQHMGLSQYYDGVPEWGVEAGTTLSPEQISPWHDSRIIGGDQRYPSSSKSMINWLFLVRDAFHLNTRMYRKVLHHTYFNVLRHVIKQDQDELPNHR